MDSNLEEALKSMVDEMQGLYKDDVTIAGAPYNAILSGESLEQDIGPGGFREVIRMNISVKKSDFTEVPLTGIEVVAREKNWRIFTVNPTLITYEIVVESPKK